MPTYRPNPSPATHARTQTERIFARCPSRPPCLRGTQPASRPSAPHLRRPAHPDEVPHDPNCQPLPIPLVWTPSCYKNRLQSLPLLPTCANTRSSAAARFLSPPWRPSSVPRPRSRSFDIGVLPG